jgi:hypothetical protein
VADACDELLKVCILISGDTFEKISDLDELDLTGFTIEMVDVPMALLAQVHIHTYTPFLCVPDKALLVQLDFAGYQFETVGHSLQSAHGTPVPTSVPLPDLRSPSGLRASVAQYAVDGGWRYNQIFYPRGFSAGPNVISHDDVAVRGGNVAACGPAYVVSANGFKLDLEFRAIPGYTTCARVRSSHT